MRYTKAEIEREVLGVVKDLGSAIPTGAERMADDNYKAGVKRLIDKGTLTHNPPHYLVSQFH